MSVVQRAFLEKGSLHYKFCTVENGEKNKWTCYLLGSTKYPNNFELKTSPTCLIQFITQILSRNPISTHICMYCPIHI